MHLRPARQGAAHLSTGAQLGHGSAAALHVDVPCLELPRVETRPAGELQLELVRSTGHVEDRTPGAFDGQLPRVEAAYVHFAAATRRDGAIRPTRKRSAHDRAAAPGDSVQLGRLDGHRHLPRAPDA